MASGRCTFVLVVRSWPGEVWRRMPLALMSSCIGKLVLCPLVYRIIAASETRNGLVGVVRLRQSHLSASIVNT